MAHKLLILHCGVGVFACALSHPEEVLSGIVLISLRPEQLGYLATTPEVRTTAATPVPAASPVQGNRPVHVGPRSIQRWRPDQIAGHSGT